MEAIGELSGSVAHDFNNLLTIIIASAESVLYDMTPSSPYYEEICEILTTTERGAALTRQLLT
ncbi:MAG: hybrid sensor histidine kinase/response regulator, partial [Deltaproteobacteria bacterium CG_4_9_14_3_um_filter_63_12]